MRHDPLADVFSALKNTEAIGRKECAVPNSKLIRSILKVIHDNKYIGGMDVIEDGRGGKVKVRLVGRINNCNVIKPSFSVKIFHPSQSPSAIPSSMEITGYFSTHAAR